MKLMFVIIIISILSDIVTGIGKATFNQNLSSCEMINGIKKHINIFLFIVLLHIVNRYYGHTLNSVLFMFNTFIVTSYILSILENLSELGFNFPSELISILEKNTIKKMINYHLF